MKKWVLIGCVLFALPLVADDYVDDVYYSDKVQLEQQMESGTLTPYYNKRQMMPMVFETDTLAAQTDTLCVGH